jgi:hypothetical protein
MAAWAALCCFVIAANGIKYEGIPLATSRHLSEFRTFERVPEQGVMRLSENIHVDIR